MLIKTYILTIITVVIMTTIAEGIMPDGNMKKYISLVMGVVILIAVSSPIIRFSQGIFKDKFDFETDRAEYASNTLTQKLEDAISKETYDNFRSKLNTMAEDEIYRKLNIRCRAETILEEGVIKRIKIYNSQSGEIRTYIKDRFGLECVFETDGDANGNY